MRLLEIEKGGLARQCLITDINCLCRSTYSWEGEKIDLAVCIFIGSDPKCGCAEGRAICSEERHQHRYSTRGRDCWPSVRWDDTTIIESQRSAVMVYVYTACATSSTQLASQMLQYINVLTVAVHGDVRPIPRPNMVGPPIGMMWLQAIMAKAMSVLCLWVLGSLIGQNISIQIMESSSRDERVVSAVVRWHVKSMMPF